MPTGGYTVLQTSMTLAAMFGFPWLISVSLYGFGVAGLTCGCTIDTISG